MASLFYSKLYSPNEIHKDRNLIYNFWPRDGESTTQAWGRLKLLMLKCPIHELPNNIQENAEAWENDKGRRSGINYDYECIKSFMGTDDFRDISTEYGLDSQSIANCFKAFASYIEIPKKKWNKYHAPYKDVASHVPVRNTKVC